MSHLVGFAYAFLLLISDTFGSVVRRPVIFSDTHPDLSVQRETAQNNGGLLLARLLLKP